MRNPIDHPLSEEQVRAAMAVLAGTATASQEATRLGTSEAQVDRWASQVAGRLSAPAVPPAAPERPWRRVAAVGFAAALLVAIAVAPVEADRPGLVSFSSGDPAVAEDVNGNFDQVYDWIAGKVGDPADPNLTVPSATLSFGTSVRQMVNLFDTRYGIGVQDSTLYNRSNAHFAWFVGGVHNGGALNAGGGTHVMTANTSGLQLQTGSLTVPKGGMAGTTAYQGEGWVSCRTVRSYHDTNYTHNLLLSGTVYTASNCTGSPEPIGSVHYFCASTHLQAGTDTNCSSNTAYYTNGLMRVLRIK